MTLCAHETVMPTMTSDNIMAILMMPRLVEICFLITTIL